MSLFARLRQHHSGLEGKEFIAAHEAEQFIAWMRAHYPDELDEWLRAKAVSFATAELGYLERRERKAALQRAINQRFDGADFTEVNLFRISFVVDDENTRRPLGAMRAADLRYVADRYEAEGNHALAMAAFLRALAKRAGDRPVSEVMDENRVAELLRSALGHDAIPKVA